MSQDGPGGQSRCIQPIYSLIIWAYGTKYFAMAIPQMDKFDIKKAKWQILLTSNISSGNTAFVALS